ncbi:WhiB family transcriptional regulator [Brachybacterium kimchii]|uniref:Transcriptional regulator WhiB n=1 Tax=Brachybacterium kimchii TaxID=2942909 RepID=A0ABY4NAQ0_9MICO|nr:WhiB family transcriptional regulator [Brachybacterium kimchii]UQN31635.1 WhiB family transcriptional regulator [Brachybacterium kimchii]
MQLPVKPAWMDDALCTQTDTELFFPGQFDSGTAKAAKQVCAKCPVREACLEWAVTEVEHGIWGGTTDQQRRRIRRERKDAAA